VKELHKIGEGGFVDGVGVGKEVGDLVRLLVGFDVGESVGGRGLLVGTSVGLFVGLGVGESVRGRGLFVGASVGNLVGEFVGNFVGFREGFGVDGTPIETDATPLLIALTTIGTDWPSIITEED
jgi:hypothetical protein